MTANIGFDVKTSLLIRRSKHSRLRNHPAVPDRDIVSFQKAHIVTTTDKPLVFHHKAAVKDTLAAQQRDLVIRQVILSTSTRQGQSLLSRATHLPSALDYDVYQALQVNSFIGVVFENVGIKGANAFIQQSELACIDSHDKFPS